MTETQDPRIDFMMRAVELIDAEPPFHADKELLALVRSLILVRGDDSLRELFQGIVDVTKAEIRKRIIQEFAPEGSIAQRMGILYGQCFKWRGMDNIEIVWAIEACKEIIGSREPQVVMRPQDVALALERNNRASEIDEAYAMTTDLSKPLIAVASPESSDPEGAMILIDGWHRLLKAKLTNHQAPLLVHLLSREEEMQCRIMEMT